MKSLGNIDNVQRSKLLASLLPDQIEGFLTHLKQEAEELITNQELARQIWKENYVLSFGEWVQIAQHLYNEITRKIKEITLQPKVFSELLFCNSCAFFSTHHLKTYASTATCSEPMQLAIKLLFTEWQ
ncbi:hypothetical protein [Puia dinghuensis]|uniref:Uncharacterized protein n=1 Tax=Puia dinghuensis TaxID=1792502 RepID=A0A8J2UB66_9BACT|nr:hypothetical protein [Puia dinghuensis]GGA92539.1 hypothetical protein GCM10011511_14890 [Puia dinghuensis]